MKALGDRVDKLEQKGPPTKREFFGWLGNPWTPEQEAEAIRRKPQQRMFYRDLLETPEETARKMADPTAVF